MKLLPWQLEAIEDLKNTDLSYQEIGIKYGRHRDTIIKLKGATNTVRSQRPMNGPRKVALADAISPEHRTLGIRLTLFRANRPMAELSKELNVSRIILHQLELGTHDPSLSRLQRISEVMGVPIATLLSPYRVSHEAPSKSERTSS